jgi:predicted phage tail protein
LAVAAGAARSSLHRSDGGAYQQVLDEAVDGKTTTRYERSRRVDLPPATTGWQIRVRRITPNQNTNKIADTMLVAGYTEVIDAKLRYPNTALLYIEFDAEQFTNIPAVTVDCNGRKWQVPSNYDPVARTYSGVWDGTFKSAWTNNPAWVTFGICTTDRFGLGKRIKPFMVDKWELYRIAQYCDQLVPDGIGGQEPRFLCDMNLQGKAEAWTLLRDISAIYRGMAYWAEGQIVMQADMPRAQDIDYVFTRANVIDGKFSYGSASTKTRYTRAIVSFDNPANNYDTDVTAFADPDLQRRFGDKPVEISAIGCTRASEAQRRGKWAVLSNNQDRTVTFKTGMEGAIPLPGYIIPIADSLLAGREIGGRISATAGRVVTLDRDTQAKAGDRLIINLPSGKAEGRTVQSVAGRAVTVTTAYSETPAPQLQWALDADDLAIPLYRVLSRKRTAEGDYEIAALQFEPGKFAYIDTGARLEERPISVIPITVVPAPASVTLTATSAIDQGIAINTMTITWPAVNGAVGYDVEWRKDNGNWIRVQRTGSTSVDITGIYSGAYLARVRAVSAYDISSIWRSSMLTQLNGKEGLPPAVTSLTTESLIFGIGLKWTFPPGAEDTQRTELWYSEAPQLESAIKLADLAYPQSDYTMQGLRAGQSFFFWARLVDRTGNVGSWFPQAPTVVNGQASADADDILDYLVGQITESQLGQELLSEIDKIGGDGPGSVNDRLDQVKSDLSDQITDVSNTVTEVQAELQAQIDQIPNGGYIDLQLYATEGPDPKLVAGQAYTLSVNARMSSPSARLAMYIQWINSSGSVISTSQLPETAVGTTFTRMSFSATAPVGTVAGHIYAGRLLNRSGATADMWIELDNVQLQEGSVLTAYSPSVQAVTNAQVATSAAVISLQSAVTQNGNDITSISARTTSLENAVNSTTNGLATKASASSVDTLTNRVTAVEGVNTAQASSITDLQTSVSTIQGSLGASGLDPAEGASWNFDSTAEGWAAANSSLTFPSAGVMRQTANASDPSINISGLAINGGLYSKIRVSITRRAGTPATDWDGSIYYVTSGHGISGSYTKKLANPNLAVGASTVLEFDMAALTAGGTDWVTSTITAIRLDIGALSGSAFDIDWIAVGRVAPSASSRALSSLTSTVTQQGSTISSQAQSITGLTTTVNNQGAALQVQATALADTSGKVSSSYTVKLGVMADGRRWAAGFGIGLDNSSGTTQSQFVVSADTFAVLNADSSANGTFTSPFMVSGGQVFIRDTVIQKATITNALIGQSIYSQTLTNYGQPVMITDYNSGQITIQNKATNGKYMILREDGLFAVSGGVVILELRV